MRPCGVAVLADANLVGRRQALNVRRKEVLPGDGYTHAKDGPHQKAVGTRRTRAIHRRHLESEVVDAAHALTATGASIADAYGITSANFAMSHAAVGQRSAHSPQCRQLLSQIELRLHVRRDGEAAHRTHVDARVAFDAELRLEVCLDIAVEAAFDFSGRLLGREAELHLEPQLREALDQLRVLHLRARRRIEVVRVRPRMHAHLRALEVHALWRTLGDRTTLAMLVNGDGRLMAVLHCPDDVLGTPCGVAAEEHTGSRALKRHLVDDR